MQDLHLQTSDEMRRPAARSAARASFSSLTLALAVGLVFSLPGCRDEAAADREALAQKARQLQQAGRYEESLDPLVEMIDGGDRDAEMMFRYGLARAQTGQPARAQWALDFAMDDPEWIVPAGHLLANNFYRSGNYENAIDTLHRLRDERPDDPEDDIPAMLLEARAYIQSSSGYEEALEMLDIISETLPDEDQVLRLRAVALLGLKRPDEAYEVIRAAQLEWDPDRDPAEVEAELDAVGRDVAEDEGGSEGDADAPAVADADAAEDDTEGVESSFAGAEAEVAAAQEAYWCTVRATFKQNAGEVDEAVQIVEACVEEHPASEGLVDAAIKLYAGTRQWQKILPVLERAHEEAPQNPGLREALVRHLTTMGRTEEAIEVLRAALDREQNAEPPSNDLIAARWVSLGTYLLERNRVDEGIDALAEAITLLGDRASSEVLIRQAEALVIAERFDEAKAHASRPQVVEIHRLVLLGRVAFERGDYAEADQLLFDAARVWPNNAPVRYYRARALEGLGRFDDAVEEYRQGMRSDPGLEEVRERLARLHLNEGRVREALGIIGFRSPKLREGASGVRLKLLSIEAKAQLGQDPNLAVEPTADYPLGKLRVETARAITRGLRRSTADAVTEEVITQLEASTPPGARGAFTRERVELLLERGAQSEAVEAARAALETAPQSVDARLALARALSASADPDALTEAGELTTQVLSVRPDDVDAITIEGDIAAARGQVEDAIALYDRALALSPESWRAMEARFRVQVESGQREAGVARLERFVARDAPYLGAAAYRLASSLRADEGASKERLVSLALQSIRFGAGLEAIELLADLDPEMGSAVLERYEARRAPASAQDAPKAVEEPSSAAEPS